MSDLLIQRLIEVRLQRFADTEQLKVYHENESVPQGECDYLRFTLLPAPAQSDDLEGKHTIFTGVAQIDVATQPGIGTRIGRERIDALRTLFPMNLILKDGSFALTQITPLQSGPASPDRTRFLIPTRFRYRADTVG